VGIALQVRKEMALIRGQYEQQVGVLEGKLRWYAENQQLLTDNEALLHEQAEVIAELQRELCEGGRSGDAARKQVADLQRQVRLPPRGTLVATLAEAVDAVIPCVNGSIESCSQNCHQHALLSFSRCFSKLSAKSMRSERQQALHVAHTEPA
jgi:hypothetical protein